MVYVPARYEADVPAPVVYEFHGALSTRSSSSSTATSGRSRSRTARSLVLPDALGTRRRWSPLGPSAFAGDEGVDDLAFFDDLPPP